ncbi:MAG: beta-eliminating lyase-related protein [Bacteroidales bacterium]
MRHSFGSDNHAPVAPQILNAIIEANNGFAVAYGSDTLTHHAERLFQNLFKCDATPLFLLNGTGANVLALSGFSKSYYSILTPQTAHINVDECGAVEKFTGCKIVPLPHKNGKVSLHTVANSFEGLGFQHSSQPLILSISQPTELGTLYTPQEIRELAQLMHSYGGFLHIDGARISNAAAALNLEIPQFTSECGVDSLSFGGTKNGLMMGEAVLLFDKRVEEELKFYRKQATQLLSKQRFIAAQFIAYLKEDLHLKLAGDANRMALYLKELLEANVPQVTITQPVETNAVFATIPPQIIEPLMERHHFYIWNSKSNEVRWVCSYATQKEDIEHFVKDIKDLISLTH